MKHCSFLILFQVLLAFLLAGNVLGQELYNELYRPGYHYSPPRHWMNDPNGLLYFAGEYHLFYQYNPYGDLPANISWGHAVSQDLVDWETLDVAIPNYADVQIFSGSAVADTRNTSGLCTNEEGCMIAAYTAASPGKQVQAIAFSNDRGRSWTRYENNPVIDENLSQFRDPKVFWDNDNNQWVMATVLADIQKVRFYSSQNLREWTFLSDFGPAGDNSTEWECPDLYRLNVTNGAGPKWVLSLSLGGTKQFLQYYIGEFDGRTFTNSNLGNVILRIDYGKDYYAPITWNDDPQGRRLMIGWMNNWQYARQTPTNGWRGSFSIIRQLSLYEYPEGIRLIQTPISGLQQLRSSSQRSENITLAYNATRLPLQEAQFELIVEFEFETDQSAEVGVKVFVGTDQETVIGYSIQSHSLFVDRTRSGRVDFNRTFPARPSAPLAPVDGVIGLRIFVDQSSVEVFDKDGRVSITSLVFPDPTQDAVELYALGGIATVRSVETWTLNSIWSGAPRE